MKLRSLKFKSVKSTNDIALKLIKKDNIKPSIILSERQTKGRGTMGKKWISKKGNLYISIFFKLDQNRINFKQFAILNAFLIRKIISKNINKNIQIKWPNDLIFNKKKFCGILQETVNFDHFNFLIVGIGINTNTAPKNKSFQSTCLKNIIDKKVNNNKILKEILIYYEKFLKEARYMSFLELKTKYK